MIEKVNIKHFKIFCLFLFLIFSLCFLNYSSFYNSNNADNYDSNHPKTSTTKQWLRNTDFSSDVYWNIIEGTSGDNSTVEAFFDQGNANFRLIGDNLSTEFSDYLNDGTWNRTRNENFLFPDVAENRSYGLFVSHDYNEAINQTRQYHSVHWKKVINTGLDMSKYTIMNASLEVLFNATVSTNLEVLGEGSRYTVGDFARFYVYISDIGELNRFRVAYNRTISLGYNISYTTIIDTILETVGQSDIIQALNAAFEKDPLHQRALLTLGMDVYCEDNEGSDRDTFTSLLFKSLNLTFTSVKSIKKFTTISLLQITDRLEQENIQINSAQFGFTHKIDQIWPSDLSPFTEVRIILNENQYKESILLSSVNNSFQDAKLGGYDVSNLILKNVNITVSIELFIANDFGLESNRTISFDNIYLNIDYTFVESPRNALPLIIGLSGSIAGAVLAFILYQTIFKYPVKVRKIRRLKRKIRKGKSLKSLNFPSKNEILDKIYSTKSELINIEKK